MHESTVMINQNDFLSNEMLRAVSSSLALAATVLGFEIVELWNQDDTGKLKCIYVHAEADVIKRFPNIIHGHYPNHRKEHIISPSLCEKALATDSNYHWASNEDIIEHKDSYLDIKTEMSYLLHWPHQDIKSNVYIVSFSSEQIEFKKSKLKFLSGLGFAIYAAAFMDEEAEEKLPPTNKPRCDSELDENPADIKKHAIRSVSSMTFLNNLAGSSSSIVSMSGGQQHLTSSSHSSGNDEFSFYEDAIIIEKNLQAVPTWEPSVAFLFNISKIPVRNNIPGDLTMDMIRDIKHVADGSNSKIYTGRLSGTMVVVKMVREDVQNDPQVIQEFDSEHGMLSRMSHPNIVQILGSGWYPRRFIVLEWLQGGSLHHILLQNQVKPGIALRLFRRPTFTYNTLLKHALDIAKAFIYLQTEIFEGAVVIHRDLKPDNIGFTAAGTVKLFDFGLCTCICDHKEVNDVYDMTGNTGSLRYMAPEVASRHHYNEKADVYSFGIVIWQMARDRVPFKGMSRDEFYKYVVTGNQRPKLDRSWPTQFSDLLTRCWDPNHVRRPSFREVAARLGELAAAADSTGKWQKGRLIGLSAAKDGGAATQSKSSWF